MAFSSRVGPRIILIMLIFLPAQGLRRNNNSFNMSSCCAATSKANIPRQFTDCFEQKQNSNTFCNIHAFIMITNSGQQWCIDPEAPWLQRRLARLNRRGIVCKTI